MPIPSVASAFATGRDLRPRPKFLVIESFVKLDLAGKIREILYLPDAYEFTQGFMNQALFCPRRTDGKSRIEQVIIDDDIGSHSVSPHCVYDAYHTHQGCLVNMNVVDGFVDRVPGLPFACHKGGEGGSGSRSIPENILLDLSKKFEQNLFSGPRHVLERWPMKRQGGNKKGG